MNFKALIPEDLPRKFTFTVAQADLATNANAGALEELKKDLIDRGYIVTVVNDEQNLSYRFDCQRTSQHEIPRR